MFGVKLPGNAQTADVRGPEPRPSVKLPILPDIAPEEVGAKHQSTVRRQTVRVYRRSLARFSVLMCRERRNPRQISGMGVIQPSDRIRHISGPCVIQPRDGEKEAAT